MKARMLHYRWLCSLMVGLMAFCFLGASGPTTRNVRQRTASAGPGLSINAALGSYSINPDIYGACDGKNANAAFARESSLPLCRWGGDSTTRYNWQVNATNVALDFWFLGGGSKTATPGATVDAFIDQNNAVGARSLITIPMIPSIEKSNANLCSYSIKKYGYANVGGWGAFWFDFNGQGKNGVDKNYDCADGITTQGHHIFTGNDPHDTSTDNSPALQQAWVQHLVQRYGPSSQSHILYELDNEPSNWGYMDRDVFNHRPTYAELIAATEQYAPAIKQADPTAQIAGPNDLGFAWNPDAGGTPNMIQYLQAMRQYEQQHGQRILDIFSEHYPDGNSVDVVRKLVDQYYPGTQIGFDEWNLFPKSDPLGGALATADELGVFARDRVAEAAYWGLDDPTKPNAYAFRMYRNYDGQGSRFGDTYLTSTSTDTTQLAIYGARRSTDGALTVMIINKTGSDLTSSVALTGFTPGSSAHMYQYSTAAPKAIVHQPDLAVSPSGFSATYPAYSITLVAIPAVATATTTGVPTATPISTPTVTTSPGALASTNTDSGTGTGPQSRRGPGGGTPSWLLGGVTLIGLGAVGNLAFLWWRRRRATRGRAEPALASAASRWEDAPVDSASWQSPAGPGDDTFTAAWEHFPPPHDDGVWRAPAEWDE